MSHAQPVPYISVRCRRVDSSLGTAVKWFPSRYLKERCGVTLGRDTVHVLVFSETLPDCPGKVGALFYSLTALSLPAKHILYLSFKIICVLIQLTTLLPTRLLSLRTAGLLSKIVQCWVPQDCTEMYMVGVKEVFVQ